MKNQNLQKTVLTILILAIFGYSYYTFYLSNQIKVIGELRQSVNKKETTVKNLTQRRPSIDSEIKTAKQQSSKYDEAIPDTFDKKELILYFYNLIKTNGLSSDKITISDPADSSTGYKVSSISIKIDGDANSTKNFLKTIENDKRKFTIKQVSMTQNDKGLISLTISIEAYSLK